MRRRLNGEDIQLLWKPAASPEAMKTMLIRLGYTVLAAATPGEAIRRSVGHSGPLDLLVTDVIMPEMNGQDLANNLRPDLKCPFISGYSADYVSPQNAFAEGAFYLQKPFLMYDLALKIKAIKES
jgi:CheY-like chemotaxis protein